MVYDSRMHSAQNKKILEQKKRSCVLQGSLNIVTNNYCLGSAEKYNQEMLYHISHSLKKQKNVMTFPSPSLSKQYIISAISFSDHVKSWAPASLRISLRVKPPFPDSVDMSVISCKQLIKRTEKVVNTYIDFFWIHAS